MVFVWPQAVKNGEGAVPSGVSVVINERDPHDENKFIGVGRDRCQVLETGKRLQPEATKTFWCVVLTHGHC